MKREDALEVAAEILFDAYLGLSPNGFSYHYEYGIVPYGYVPSGANEEEFVAGATLIEDHGYLETFLMAIEKDPPL